MSHLNDQIALGQIREALGLRPSVSLAQVVAAVRELKANRPEPLRSRRVFRAPMDLTKHQG